MWRCDLLLFLQTLDVTIQLLPLQATGNMWEVITTTIDTTTTAVVGGDGDDAEALTLCKKIQ